MKIEFIEQGEGFPQNGNILVDHAECIAYRVLPDIPMDFTGSLQTHGMGMPNTCTLHVEQVDYDDFFEKYDYGI